MRISSKTEHFLLLLGDIGALFVSLWLALLFRYQALPDSIVWSQHVQAFSLLFVVWLGVFYVAGMYEKQTLSVKRGLPGTILNTQITNSIIAVLFFYFIPYFGIAPKTNLFIYLGVSFITLFLWRTYGYTFFNTKKRRPAVLVAGGADAQQLFDEVNANPRYDIVFTEFVDISALSKLALEEKLASLFAPGYVVVLEMAHPTVQTLLPRMYEAAFSGATFLDVSAVYEDVFDRIPATYLTHQWFLEHVSLRKAGYDAVKRAMDIMLSFIAGIVSLLFYPFVALAIKIGGGGSVFFTQERVGQNGKIIRVHKFRTMVPSDEKGVANAGPRITRVGGFLRKTRLDELPQLWNVLRGDMSMIGPRPELPHFVALYEKEVPYYRVRHIIKPGLSGWAQMYHKNPPKGDADAVETKTKLSYDLYYIKHRSFWFDVQIALKTVKVFVSRSGK